MSFAQVCFHRFNQEEALNCVQIGADCVSLQAELQAEIQSDWESLQFARAR